MQLPSEIRLRWLTREGRAVDEWYEWLGQAERAEIESFGHPERREEFVTGRAALRLLLSELNGIAPDEVGLRTADDGAVEARAPDAPSVSLAHTGPHAVAVAAPHPIGVDIETIQPRREDLHRFLLHPDEYHIMDELDLRRAELLVLLWTIKESTLKGLRTGFRRSPKTLRLSIDAEAGRAGINVIDGEPWEVLFERRQECWLSVAYPARTA